jgi:uncharacterized protein (TIGR02679 family)
MSEPDSSATYPPGALRAAAFFRQPVWARLLDIVYEKYIAQGRAGGQVVLRACTTEERREIARFLGKRLSAEETLVVRLADFQQALDASGFRCELAELLAALYPERPQVTRPDQRRQRAQAQQRFYEALSALAEDLPAGTRGQNWLLSGKHGREFLFLHHKNDEPAFQQQVLRSARHVSKALNQLPTPPTYERLSLFAQRVSGDPHLLDIQSESGRLFLYALQDLPALSHAQDESEETAAPTTDDAEPPSQPGELLEEEGFSPRAQNRLRLLLYYQAGLLTDTISSTVAVCRLAGARDVSGAPDPLVADAGRRVLVLPLRQLLCWQKLTPASRHVYLFENPQVFETIIDELLQRTGPGDEPFWPTLVCTAGWPGVAVIRLLDLLTHTHPQTLLHYSGDFDLAGLRIAAYLQDCYRAHLRFWHLDAQAYQAALHQQGVAFANHELAALQTLPASLTPLVTAMQTHRQKAYQEGITRLLLQDITSTPRD